MGFREKKYVELLFLDKAKYFLVFELLSHALHILRPHRKGFTISYGRSSQLQFMVWVSFAGVGLF